MITPSFDYGLAMVPQPCDFSFFYYKSLLKNVFERSTCTCSYKGKKEVACIVSKPQVSCLWGCGESVNPPKLTIQEVQGALSSRPKGDPGPLTHSSRFVTFVKSHPWFLFSLVLTNEANVHLSVVCPTCSPNEIINSTF